MGSVCVFFFLKKKGRRARRELTSGVRSKLAPVGIHVGLYASRLLNVLEFALISGGPSQVSQFCKGLYHVGILDDVDVLAETLVLALAVRHVRLYGAVELDLEWVREDSLVLGRVDEADKELVALLENDVLTKLIDRDGRAVGRLHVTEDSQAIGQASALESVLCDELVGLGSVECCETLDFGPVLLVVVLEVEVDQLRKLNPYNFHTKKLVTPLSFLPFTPTLGLIVVGGRGEGKTYSTTGVCDKRASTPQQDPRNVLRASPTRQQPLDKVDTVILERSLHRRLLRDASGEPAEEPGGRVLELGNFRLHDLPQFLGAALSIATVPPRLCWIRVGEDEEGQVREGCVELRFRVNTVWVVVRLEWEVEEGCGKVQRGEVPDTRSGGVSQLSPRDQRQKGGGITL